MYFKQVVKKQIVFLGCFTKQHLPDSPRSSDRLTFYPVSPTGPPFLSIYAHSFFLDPICCARYNEIR